ncbi:GTP 3',8-cyclase MoaA [Parapusillimonas granuli]|uniref:GTP 3',8-cyclase n=1 Tax=Parapusillimonas granuli TaxID=380911 RepID=A0A853G2H0_9BURK|nr:GTP 3',8-cyclase MoaA [Parapusillimonas granuli]MBB5214878.1 cyclic pyranopterin phosphate synthase [Parapusillimonas granuli]MEB2399926.1 GTP 3',8-cyclase MoaA [Alcaligenaceae bacterium]NYT49200.1 GTP 3',8-cyclase MoaA [Parapusillimonas granuli]
MNTERPPRLVDRFGRRIDYLRVSVTDRCDLRCQYCMPKDFKGFEEPSNWLTHDEMARLIGLFAGLGVGKVRLTGGEPLMRRGVAELAARISAMPQVRDLSLSTNGTTLARHAAALKAAGVGRLNVSLDSLDAARVREITGRDCLQDVLAGLAAARRAGFAPIKLNCVVHAQTPEAELARLLGYTLASGFILRLIETMPMGSSGQQFQPANLTLMGARLAERFGLVPALDTSDSGPARYWTAGDDLHALGVITPMSRHFCATCNRVRLSVDGTLYLCLGQENQVPLGRLMRQGADDDELIGHILAGIAAKPERHEFDTAPRRIVRFMSQTGG